jgi:hypothetical protein
MLGPILWRGGEAEGFETLRHRVANGGERVPRESNYVPSCPAFIVLK